MARNIMFKEAVVTGSNDVFEAWLAGLDVAELRLAQRSCSDWICRANNPVKYPAMRPASVQALKPQVAARKGIIDTRVAELVPREPGRIGMTPDEIAAVTDSNELFAIKNALQSTYSKRKQALEGAQDMLSGALAAGDMTADDVALLKAEVAKRQKLLDQVAPGKEAAMKAWKATKHSTASTALKHINALTGKENKSQLLALIAELKLQFSKELE